MTDNSCCTEQKRFQDLEFDLLTQNEILKEKLSNRDISRHGGELKTVWMMESWSTADSLRRMENQMKDDRDHIFKLDQSILVLYIKILSIQLSKVSSTLKKLEHIIHKDNGNVDCPVDYTVQSYQEWSRTNPKLHALQSHVLELLSKKIKYRSKFIEEEKIRTFSMARRTSQTNATSSSRIRSQTLFYLERDPLVDADFTLHISKVTHIEANTFEAERLRHFISYCWENEFADDLDSMYQQFVGALVEHVMNKFGHMRRSGINRSDLSRDQIFAIIESHLIPHIYDCIQKHHPDDVIMKHQYLELKNKSQKDLGIQACYVDNSLIPYHDAISKLREISLVKLPTQKLRSIILASQNAIKRMNELCADEEVVAGADEFIDIWVYITIQASIPNLCWDIHYLKAYSNPNYMLSETGYYLSSLEMAAEYIKRLDSMDSLDSGGTEVKNDEPRLLLLPDAEVARRLCERDGRLFKLVEKEYVLEGYQFATTLDMIRDSSRTLRIALTATPQSDHVVRLQQIKLSERCNDEMVSRYLRTNCFKDVSLVQLFCGGGLVPIISADTAEDDTITFSNVNEDWPELIKFSTLSFLGGCCESVVLETISDLREANEKVAEKLLSSAKENNGYEISGGNGSVDDSLKKVILDVQGYLEKLHFYSKWMPRDGLCSKILQKSLQSFQEWEGSYHQHRTDGICDYQTYERLKALASQE